MPGGGLCLEPFAGKRGGRVRDAAHCPNCIPAKPETTARTLQLAVARRMGRVDGLPIFHPFILPVTAFGLYADRPSFYPEPLGDAHRHRQCSAAGTPSLFHTVTAPVTGPASARSRVAVSMGSVPAATRKLSYPRPVSQTISSGNGLPAAAIRRYGPSFSATLPGRTAYRSNSM